MQELLPLTGDPRSATERAPASLSAGSADPFCFRANCRFKRRSFFRFPAERLRWLEHTNLSSRRGSQPRSSSRDPRQRHRKKRRTGRFADGLTLLLDGE